MGVFEEALARVVELSPERQAAVRAQAQEYLAGKNMRCVPNPGPQTEAYRSQADVMLYGGEPGGGKSFLSLALAFNEHSRSLIMRRQYTDLSGLIDDAIKINGSRDGFTGQPPPRLTFAPGRFIDFGAAAKVGDEQHWMGKAHDLIVFDEGTQFAYTQVRFVMGWLRHENPEQRTRVVIPTNPPLTADGLWVLSMFAPWLDDKYPRPARPGELRWVVTDGDGNDIWVDGPEDARKVMIAGEAKLVQPKSRTFIPSSVDDNPYYAAGSYRTTLDAMIEPHRSILLGKFKTSFKDQPNQAIPTAWIKAAQDRWDPKPPVGVPMCAIAVDCSGGGTDPMIIAPRYDGWYPHLTEVKAKDIPMHASGAFCAGHVIQIRRDQALPVIDLGGGYGGPTYEHLVANQIECAGYKGAEATTRRSVTGQLKFNNKRSAAIWLFREALDPGQPGGSPIALPPDTELLADLAAPTFKPTPNGIQIESKEDVVKRLGRSTNRGDAVVMAWFEGERWLTAALDWMSQAESGVPYGTPPGARKGRGMQTKVITSGRQPLSARR